MPLANYDEVHDNEMIAAMQVRFAKEMRQLRTLGFNEEFYIRETGSLLQGYSLSSFIMLFIMLIYLARDYFFRAAIFRAPHLLHISFYNPYLIHEDGYAYSVVGNGRIKYATIFDDGTLLHTITGESFKHVNVPEKRYLFQMPYPGDIAQSWQAHTQKVESLVNEGRSVISPLRVSDVMRMEVRSDAILSEEMPEAWDKISAKKDKF